MDSNEWIVRVENLRKRYAAPLLAVDSVSFAMRRGEIFGLLGPNGAGKTTTISMLAGLLTPTDGEIWIDGQNARRIPQARKRALGIVPQELAIYPRLTARENLEFFGQLYGLRGARLTERIATMLSLVGLTDRADSRAETYSGGMKRRLNLAAGLLHSPQVLLLDEPTVGVDPQSRNHIFEGVRQLNREGLTILYTSHYMEEVEALCDRVGIMDGGKLIACDTVPNLIASMGGAVIEVGIGGGEPHGLLLSRLRCLQHIQGVDFAFPTADPAQELEPETDRTLHEGKDVLHVRAIHPNLALPGLVAALNAANVALLSLTIKQPNLEDVFLALTGKTLRD